MLAVTKGSVVVFRKPPVTAPPIDYRQSRGLRIAVVGAGVSGLVAAYLLSQDHEVTVFEAAPRPGGHANTVDVATADGDLAVDTGFVVFNDKTLHAIAQDRPSDKQGLLNVSGIGPAKAEQYGEEVLVIVEQAGDS